jgi:MFS family permease
MAAFVSFIPMVVLGFFTGVLADRFSRRIIIALADLAQALTTVMLIVLFSLGWPSIYVVPGILALRGVCQAFARARNIQTKAMGD